MSALMGPMAIFYKRVFMTHRTGHPPIFNGVHSQDLLDQFQFLGRCDAADAHVRAVIVICQKCRAPFWLIDARDV